MLTLLLYVNLENHENKGFGAPVVWHCDPNYGNHAIVVATSATFAGGRAFTHHALVRFKRCGMPLKGIEGRREVFFLSSAHWRGSVSCLGNGLKGDHHGAESILTNRKPRPQDSSP